MRLAAGAPGERLELGTQRSGADPGSFAPTWSGEGSDRFAWTVTLKRGS